MSDLFYKVWLSASFFFKDWLIVLKIFNCWAREHLSRAAWTSPRWGGVLNSHRKLKVLRDTHVFQSTQWLINAKITLKEPFELQTFAPFFYLFSCWGEPGPSCLWFSHQFMWLSQYWKGKDDGWVLKTWEWKRKLNLLFCSESSYHFWARSCLEVGGIQENSLNLKFGFSSGSWNQYTVCKACSMQCSEKALTPVWHSNIPSKRRINWYTWRSEGLSSKQLGASTNAY